MMRLTLNSKYSKSLIKWLAGRRELEKAFSFSLILTNVAWSQEHP